MKKFTVKIEYDIYADNILSAHAMAASNHDDLILKSKLVELNKEDQPTPKVGDVVTDEDGLDHLIASAPTKYDWKEDHDAIAAKARLVATQQIKVQRNKQVDVPTEAWQKRIERDINEIRTTILNEVTRTEKTEETLIILVAYLSSVGLLDMNDWNQYLQISRK